MTSPSLPAVRLPVESSDLAPRADVDDPLPHGRDPDSPEHRRNIERISMHEVERALRAANERRTWPRVRLCAQVRLRFDGPEALVQSRTFDLSEGGAFIQHDTPRPRGTMVRIVMEVGEQVVSVDGVVVRSTSGTSGNGPPGMGVRFVNIGASDKAFLHAIVSARGR